MRVSYLSEQALQNETMMNDPKVRRRWEILSVYTLFDGIFYFGGPNRSKNKEKTTRGVDKGVTFFGAPNGATKGRKTDNK